MSGRRALYRHGGAEAGTLYTGVGGDDSDPVQW